MKTKKHRSVYLKVKNSGAKKKISKIKRKIKIVEKEISAEIPPEEGKKDTPEEKKKKEETLEEQLGEITEVSPHSQTKAIAMEASNLKQVERGEQETFKLEDNIGTSPITKTFISFS